MQNAFRTALLAIALIPCTAWGFASLENEDGEITLDATGSGRFTGAYMRYPDLPALFPNQNDGLISTVHRLLLEGGLGEPFGYEVNIYADLLRGPSLLSQGTFATAGSVETPYRQAYLTYEYWETDTVTGSLGLDRFNLTLALSPVSLTIGRVPLNYGATLIFTPNDFFAPFSTTAINKIYKPGVDAARLSIAPWMLSTIEIAAVLGNDADNKPSFGKSALITHLRTVLWEYEWALLGGKLAERWIVGASLQGQVGPLGLRAEGHVGFPDEQGDGTLDDRDGDKKIKDDIHTRLAAGLEHLFEWHNASLSAEYMYLSDGAPQANEYLQRAMYFYPDDPLFLGRHYVGLSGAFEIIPILQLASSFIVNATDGSGLAALNLVYSLSDEGELVGGVLIPWGERPPQTDFVPSTLPSEFGVAPLTIFLETRFYY